MNWLWDRVQAEPVAAQNLFHYALTMLVILWPHISISAQLGVLGFSAALLTFLTRKAVTASPNLPPINLGR